MSGSRGGRRSDARSLRPRERDRDHQFGRWGDGGFQFNSQEDEALWQRSAYRQSVKHDGWDAQPPVDEHTQATFEAMPELAEGSRFRGPDGRHRPIGPAQKETPEIDRIRRRTFSEFASQGVTWEELGAYDPDKPHPGEDEVIAQIQSQKQVATKSAQNDAVWPNKLRDMGAWPKEADKFLGDVGNIDLDVNDLELWAGNKLEAGKPPVLVANNGKLTPGSLPKNLLPEPKFLPPLKPLPDFQKRRGFVEGLIGKAANDNRRSTAKDNAPPVGIDGQPGTLPVPGPQTLPTPGTPGNNNLGAGSASAVETDPELQVANELFNWKRLHLKEPSPAEFAVYAASDEGRYSFLEDQKDEWSRQLGSNPESVLPSIVAEFDSHSNAAQRDFFTSHHRLPNETELAEINDAVARIVFAPAERWSEGKRHLGGEPEPYIGIVEPLKLPAEDIASVFLNAAQAVERGQSQKSGGRPGNKDTRDAVKAMMERFAAAIKACGGKVTGEFFETKEKFLPSEKGVPGSSWPDALTTFEYNGHALGVMANHGATYADGITLKPNGFNQIQKWGYNIGEALKKGNLEVEAVGVGYFSKKKKNESFEDYVKRMDEFVSKMINCRRPFLIKVKVKKTDTLSPATNDNTP